jgi:hypothetical protein
LPYSNVYDPTVGFVPAAGFSLLGDVPTEEEVEIYEEAEFPSEEPFKGLLNGAKFDDETANLVWEIIVAASALISFGSIPIALGTIAQLLKIAGKNPWLRKPIGEYIKRTFGPLVEPVAGRMGLRKAASKLDAMAKKPALTRNPVAKSVLQSGAMGGKALSMRQRLMFLDRSIDLDVDIDLQELDRFLESESSQDFEIRGPASEEQEFEMAYGYRRGYRAWVPYHIWKRRQRRGYRSGSRSGGGYGGYGNRRSYRRW